MANSCSAQWKNAILGEFVHQNKERVLKRTAAMPGPPETTSGFLLAVRDCCLALASDIKVPGPIIEDLGRRGGLDPVSLQQLRLEQRLIKDLITQLKSHFVDDRQRAAQALGGIGPAAADAVPALIDALKDQDADVRELAAEALGEIRQLMVGDR